MIGNSLNGWMEMDIPHPTDHILVHSHPPVTNRKRIPNMVMHKPCNHLDNPNLFNITFSNRTTIHAILS